MEKQCANVVTQSFTLLQNWPGPDWIPGTIVEVLGSLTFIVEIQDGRRWKRQFEQLKDWLAPTISNNSISQSETHPEQSILSWQFWSFQLRYHWVCCICNRAHCRSNWYSYLGDRLPKLNTLNSLLLPCLPRAVPKMLSVDIPTATTFKLLPLNVELFILSHSYFFTDFFCTGSYSFLRREEMWYICISCMHFCHSVFWALCMSLCTSGRRVRWGRTLSVVRSRCAATLGSSCQWSNEICQACNFILELLNFRWVSLGVSDCWKAGHGYFYNFVRCYQAYWGPWWSQGGKDY